MNIPLKALFTPEQRSCERIGCHFFTLIERNSLSSSMSHRDPRTFFNSCSFQWGMVGFVWVFRLDFVLMGDVLPRSFHIDGRPNPPFQNSLWCEAFRCHVNTEITNFRSTWTSSTFCPLFPQMSVSSALKQSFPSIPAKQRTRATVTSQRRARPRCKASACTSMGHAEIHPRRR